MTGVVTFDERTTRGRLAARLFGDRRGLAVFVGALLVVGVLWRVGFLVNDSVAIANTLVNVLAGRLTVTESPYSLMLGTQPGLYDAGGRVVGRNYGEVIAAVPLAWLLEAARAVTDLRLALLAGWVLGLQVWVDQLAAIVDRPRMRLTGSLAALAVFAVGVLVGEPLPARWIPLLAIQLLGALALATSALLLYRLLARLHGARVGVAAAAGLVLATPLPFWATSPKRHVFTATAIIAALFLFARSRAGEPGGFASRAGAYAVLGLFASVHAFEAAFLLLVLAPVDLLTAERTRAKTILGLGAVTLLSLVPTFLLNVGLSGNPLKPPRALPDLDVAPSSPPDLGSNYPGTAGGAETPSSLPGPLAPLADTVTIGLSYARVVVDYLVGALVAGVSVLDEGGRLWHTFVRSGLVAGVNHAANEFEAIELAFLEAFPLVAALLAGPANLLRDWRAWPGLAGVRRTVRTPARATDLLAAGWALTLVVVYLPFLPLHTQITVRYIVPVVVLCVYGICRLAPVRTCVDRAPGRLLGGYGTVVVLGVGLAVAAFRFLEPAVGEAMQLHGLAGLAAAIALAAIALTWPRHRSVAWTTAALATAAGLTTVFLLFAALIHFPHGDPVLAPVGPVATPLSRF